MLVQPAAAGVRHGGPGAPHLPLAAKNERG